MIRRLVPLVVLAAGVAVAIPAQAAWNVTGTAAQTNNGKARTMAAPTSLSGTCSYNKNANPPAVSVSLTWTVSTSTVAVKQKLYRQGNATGTPVTYAATTSINDNTTHTGSDAFNHAAGSVSFKYAVSALVGNKWESAQTKTAAFTLTTAGANGSCAVAFS